MTDEEKYGLLVVFAIISIVYVFAFGGLVRLLTGKARFHKNQTESFTNLVLAQDNPSATIYVFVYEGKESIYNSYKKSANFFFQLAVLQRRK